MYDLDHFRTITDTHRGGSFSVNPKGDSEE